MLELPCDVCPQKVFPPPDEVTALAVEVWNLASWGIHPDHPTPIEFVFKLLGIPIPSWRALEVYRRLQLMSQTLREHETLTQPETKGSSPDPTDED